MIEDQLHQLEWIRNNKAGFREVKRFDGNIGYFDLRSFAPLFDGGAVADHYMALLADSDAIIVDLRKNGGGSPAMVQYLCSYFFDKKVHLNSLYYREGDRTEEFWTLERVEGKKMPDVPLYVLTSSYTFSGAEEFSYNMQTQKRATLVGETTGGGANPGGSFPLGGQLGVFIPTGKAINPITGTNWEGIGVVPEVKTSADEALDKALELAKTAAEDFRKKQRETYKVLLLDVQKSLENLDASSNQQAVLDNLKKCQQAGLLGEWDINMYGYQELQKEEGGMRAEAILWSNTQLFPQSANVYDSYGEALVMNGKLKESLKSYEKAVALAEKNKDDNLGLFKDNLEKVKAKLKAKP
jgi:tetratricopeptide (TPR) repeat protein